MTRCLPCSFAIEDLSAKCILDGKELLNGLVPVILIRALLWVNLC